MIHSRMIQDPGCSEIPNPGMFCSVLFGLLCDSSHLLACRHTPSTALKPIMSASLVSSASSWSWRASCHSALAPPHFSQRPLNTAISTNLNWCYLWHPLFKRVPKDSTQSISSNNWSRRMETLNILERLFCTDSATIPKRNVGKNPINKRSSLILRSFPLELLKTRRMQRLRKYIPACLVSPTCNSSALAIFSIFTGVKRSYKKKQTNTMWGFYRAGASLACRCKVAVPHIDFEPFVHRVERGQVDQVIKIIKNPWIF